MSDDRPLFTSLGEDIAVVKYIVKNTSANIKSGNHPCCSDKGKTISVMFFFCYFKDLVYLRKETSKMKNLYCYMPVILLI